MTEQSKIEKQLDNSSTQSAAMDLTKSSSAPMPLNTIEEKHSALLAKYHEISKIGKGSQATMLKALGADNHPVAIKVFNISVSAREGERITRSNPHRKITFLRHSFI
jgi:hypothetical protein